MARLAKHDDMPRPSSKGLMAATAWTMIVVSTVFSIVLLSHDQRYLRYLMRHLQITQEQAVIPHAPAAPQANAAPRLIMRPGANRALPPTRLIRQEPIAIRCSRLARDGDDTPELTVGDTASQCSVLKTLDGQEVPSSVFVQIRVANDGNLLGFRIKFNRGSAAEPYLAQFGLQTLRDFGGLSGELEESLSQITKDVEQWCDFRLLAGGYRLTFKRELTAPNRFNLLAQRLPSSLEDEPIWRPQRREEQALTDQTTPHSSARKQSRLAKP
jgi:hypothetical protein